MYANYFVLDRRRDIQKPFYISKKSFTYRFPQKHLILVSKPSLFVGAVEQDGDEGVGSAAVGDDLVREEDLVDAVLVADQQRLLRVLAPLSPRPENEHFDLPVLKVEYINIILTASLQST